MVQAAKNSRCFCTRRRRGENSVRVYELCVISDGKPCGPCQKAIELEARILKAQNELERLLDEETELRKSINDIHETLIHHLPLELTSYIFELTLPNEWPTWEERYSLSKNDVAAPLTLGAVCHQWRRIAWSLPRLWTYLPIAYGVDGVESIFPSSLLEVAAEWLERSGELPLSIGIHPMSDRYCEIDDQMLKDEIKCGLEPFIPLLNAHSHRWKYLDLEIPSQLLENFRGNNLGRRPILDRLRVMDDDDEYEDYSAMIAGFAMEGIQPMPTYVSLQNFDMVNINWNNATTIVVAYIAIDDFRKMLQFAEKLQHCSVVGCFSDRYLHDPFPLEVQSNLRSLALRATMDLMNLSNAKVSLPSLKDLELEINDLPFSNLLTFFNNCGAHRLSSLNLEGGIASNTGLIDMLKHTLFLEKLDLYFRNESSSGVGNLFQWLGRTCDPLQGFLPILKDLRIRFGLGITPDSSFRWGHIADIFGPIQDIDNEGKRPLTFVQVEAVFDAACNFNTLIEKADVLRLLKTRQTGVKFALMSERDGVPCDILELSTKSHDVFLV